MDFFLTGQARLDAGGDRHPLAHASQPDAGVRLWDHFRWE